LVAGHDQAVAFPKSKLKPALPPDKNQMDRWIAELDSNDFATREKATQELRRLGDLAEPALTKALNRAPMPEAKRRLEQLISGLDGPITSAELLQRFRAIEVLEWLGTRDAQEVLLSLARGEPGARLTREATASLEGLRKRSASMR
jgi:hypothetical protein